MTSTDDITRRILERCHEMGFALAGVCDAAPTQYEAEVRHWLASGMHGEMGYLTRTLDLRLDPARFVPGARSIICVADRYAAGRLAADDAPSAAPVGRIARYARGKDYHRIMRDRLGRFCRELVKTHPGHRFRSCVDTAPVLEREHAQRAGLGAIGKNSLLLERSVGSWLLLGEIITTLPLTPSRPSEPNPCGECTRCIEACPTQAIASEGWHLDATRCISYLTIEHRSLIDEGLYAAMGDWLFGCDICQEVCPHNQPKTANADVPTHPAYTPRRNGFDLLELLRWGESDRMHASINSALKRARLEMLKRNALIALGNAIINGSAPASARDAIAMIASSQQEHGIVVETARAVLRRVDSTPCAARNHSSW